MAWDDRLKQGAYVSPGGTRIAFAYEDLSRNFDKKTTGFDFPGADGTFVQDMGVTGRKYPLTAFFSGADCDLEANAFEDALSERGRGKLEHPIYGTVDVVPFGTVTRNDALKTAANQSVVEVTFWETIPLVYPIPQTDPASEILDNVQELGDALGDSVAGKLDIFDPKSIQAFKAQVTVLVESVQKVMGKYAEIKETVAAKVTEILTKVDSIVVPVAETVQSVRDTIKDVVTNVLELVAAPSEVVTSIKDKFNDYKNLIAELTSPIFPIEDETEYLSNDMMVENLVGGLIVNIVESEFDTQTGALESAENILEIFDEVNTWIEESTNNLGIIDTGESYQRLQRAVALTAGYLIEISFTRRKERKVVLTRDRSIIDLVAELYGGVDDTLDFFITSNDFSGSEILEVPRGREVLYYVD